MSLPSAHASVQGRAPRPPSVHARAVITWIAIFPLVTLGSVATAPFATDWNPVLRSLVLSVIVVPLAVYVVVPQLVRWYGKLRTLVANRSGTTAEARPGR